MSATPQIDNAPLCLQAQLWIVEYLETRESLVRGTARVPVIGRRETNIQNDIDAAIDSLGACLYVLPLLPLRFNVNLPGPFVDVGELRIRCIENDTLNTTLPSVYELVEAVVRDLHGLRLQTLAAFSCLTLADGSPVERQADSERLIYDVVFHTRGAYAARLELH